MPDLMGPVTAATSPFAFTQLPGLRATDFIRECRRRRVHWTVGQLEALHEAGLLVPLLSIRYDAEGLRQRTDPGAIDDETLSHALAYVSTTGPEFAREAAVGDLLDAASELFRPWGESGQWLGEPYRRRQHLYSTYQLLMLPLLRGVTFDGHHEADGRISYRVRDGFGHETLSRRSQSIRELASLLTVLEFVYRPRVVGRFRLTLGTDEAAFRVARRSFDAKATLAASSWEADRVREEAERLLHGAHSLDPLDDWLDLVRQVHPSRWDKLTGDALLSMDHRIAAEALLLFYEDLVAAGGVETIPGRGDHLLRHRLRPERKDLDAVLSRYGISPYPSVLLVLEGETEMVLAPKMLELVDGPGWPDRIELLNLRGLDNQRMDQKLGHVAAQAIRPRLGKVHGDVVELDRPPTRLLLAVDAEGGYQTVADRRRQRENLVTRMFDALPVEYQNATVRRELRQMVHITVWSRSPRLASFEFAHFSPRQLAQAIRMTCTSLDVPDESVLARRIESVRAAADPLKAVWKTWRTPRPSKPAIAGYLWPIMEAKAETILQRPDSGYVRLPLLRVVLRAVELASWPPRQGQAVLRYRPRKL